MSDAGTFEFDGSALRGTVDLRAYRLSAVKKAAYRVASKVTVVLGTRVGEELPITLAFKPGTPEGVAIEAGRAFFQELLDQELRELVAEETAPMRTLILAHAFSKTDLIRRE
jgi:His-Xaa-Ser system protein HxsD